MTDVRHSPEKYIFVTWASDITGTFQLELKVETLNKRGLLSVIAGVLANCNANIKNIQVDDAYSKRSILLFTIEVVNRVHLSKIIKRIRSINFVIKVIRI